MFNIVFGNEDQVPSSPSSGKCCIYPRNCDMGYGTFLTFGTVNVNWVQNSVDSETILSHLLSLFIHSVFSNYRTQRIFSFFSLIDRGRKEWLSYLASGVFKIFKTK